MPQKNKSAIEEASKLVQVCLMSSDGEGTTRNWTIRMMWRSVENALTKKAASNQR
jgi:hypothetical protein